MAANKLLYETHRFRFGLDKPANHNEGAFRTALKLQLEYVIKKHMVHHCALLKMLLNKVRKFRMKSFQLRIVKIRKKMFRMLQKLSIFQFWLMKLLM